MGKQLSIKQSRFKHVFAYGLLAFVLTLLALITLSNAKPTTATALDRAILSVSIQRYEPLPATPGSVVDVWISVENTGDEPAPNVALSIVETPVFKVYSDKSTQEIGVLQEHQEAVLHFKLKVSRTAVLGTNYLKVKYTSDKDTGYWIEEELPISVELRAPELMITEQKTVPETLKPSEEGVLTLKITNKGDTLLKDINLQLSLDDEFVCSQTGITGSNCQLVKKPIALIGSSTKRVLQDLKPGEFAELGFKFIIDNDADVGVYKIPFTISFYDEDGNQHSFNDYATIIVSYDPELMVYVDDLALQDNVLTAVITFNNPSLAQVKFLQCSVKVLNAELLNPTSNFYIGNIDSDDDETLDLKLKLDKDFEKQRDVQLEISTVFYDAFNNKHEKVFKVTIPKQKIPLAKKSKTLVTVLAILVIVLALLWIAKRLKHKKE